MLQFLFFILAAALVIVGGYMMTIGNPKRNYVREFGTATLLLGAAIALWGVGGFFLTLISVGALVGSGTTYLSIYRKKQVSS
jgi:hypothetical protein